MDVLSHGLIPFAAAAALRRNRYERAAAAVGGVAPDADTLLAWASGLHENLFALTHRGWSHTIWGAPLIAVGLLYLVSRPWLHRRWARTEVFRFDRATLVAVLLGALTHPLLDALTITGVPMFWPLSNDRVTANVFFYSITYMLIVSLVGWVQVARRRAGDRFLRSTLAVLLAIILVVGAVRIASRPPDVADDARLTPFFVDWQWIVTERNESGVVATGYSWGAVTGTAFFPEPNRTEAREAIVACETFPGMRAWLWGAWGLAVANASRAPDDGWRIGFRDGAQAYAAARDGLFGRDEAESDLLVCHVDADGTVRIDRRVGFWG